MTTPMTGTTSVPQWDFLLHSPDGESRGMFARVGDIFPLNPIRHLLSSCDEQASEVRPWGLRYLAYPRPSAGRHEGGSKQTSEGAPDGSGPQNEEMQDD